MTTIKINARKQLADIIAALRAEIATKNRAIEEMGKTGAIRLKEIEDLEQPRRSKRHRAPHPTALAYGVDEAATVLGISRRTVYELIAERRLQSLKLAGRRLVTRAACEKLLAEAIEADEP